MPSPKDKLRASDALGNAAELEKLRAEVARRYGDEVAQGAFVRALAEEKTDPSNDFPHFAARLRSTAKFVALEESRRGKPRPRKERGPSRDPLGWNEILGHVEPADFTIWWQMTYNGLQTFKPPAPDSPSKLEPRTLEQALALAIVTWLSRADEAGFCEELSAQLGLQTRREAITIAHWQALCEEIEDGLVSRLRERGITQLADELGLLSTVFDVLGVHGALREKLQSAVKRERRDFVREYLRVERLAEAVSMTLRWLAASVEPTPDSVRVTRAQSLASDYRRFVRSRWKRGRKKPRANVPRVLVGLEAELASEDKADDPPELDRVQLGMLLRELPGIERLERAAGRVYRGLQLRSRKKP